MAHLPKKKHTSAFRSPTPRSAATTPLGGADPRVRLPPETNRGLAPIGRLRFRFRLYPPITFLASYKHSSLISVIANLIFYTYLPV